MATSRSVRQLLERSLRLIGALAKGETASSTKINIALQVLQDLLAEKADMLFVPFVTLTDITLVIGQKTYTVGQNGTPDKIAQRPEQPTDAWIRDSAGYDYPVTIISAEDYHAIRAKDITSRPKKIWYNPTVPNGTVYTWPVADAAETLYISDPLSLAEPTKITENLLNDVGIPRNYHRPLAYMLAVDLAPEWGRTPSAIVLTEATKGMNKVGALNLARTMKEATIEPGTDPQRGSESNILSY